MPTDQRLCSFDGCSKKIHTVRSGLCSAHYAQQRKGQELRPVKQVFTGCTVQGCNEKNYGRGFCKPHYYLEFKAEILDTNARYREANAEQVKAYKALWRLENLDAVKEKQHIYRKANVQLLSDKQRAAYQANPEKRRAYSRQYHKDHPEKSRAHSAKRRAWKQDTFIGEIDYDTLWNESQGICYLCLTEMDTTISDIYAPGYINWDHVHPLAKGGPHVQENLRPTHRKCNGTKHDHLLSDLTLPLPSPI